MPFPKRLWEAHFISDSFEFRPETDENPPMIVFKVKLMTPDRHKGRVVEIMVGHEYVGAAIINGMVQMLREYGDHLPETMG